MTPPATLDPRNAGYALVGMVLQRVRLAGQELILSFSQRGVSPTNSDLHIIARPQGEMEIRHGKPQGKITGMQFDVATGPLEIRGNAMELVGTTAANVLLRAVVNYQIVQNAIAINLEEGYTVAITPVGLQIGKITEYKIQWAPVVTLQ